MTAWRERKEQLRSWCAAAHADGDKTSVASLQEAITVHNRHRPPLAEYGEAQASYFRRRALYEAQAPVDEAAERRFKELDRLMRQRYGVNVSDPRTT
jgi:hypothetical protein